ncbi:MAG: glutamate formimidoyltransferase [Anaerolineales bacterium]|jgi:glutamate formiminotransferase/formiminotetrahydrofolate cyclodeaminase
MSNPLVECVPNFSEGRRPEILEKIQDAIAAVPGTTLLDLSSDRDHNRSVVTFVGSPEAVEEAAFQMIKTAADLIDLNKHSGEHPRLGATDVVPFIPISDIGMEECVEIAHRVGERVGSELKIPVYFYEQAARSPERVQLEAIRRGQYEGLKEDIKTDPARKPDCGPAELGPAGATVIGARESLIAFNVYLTTTEEEISRKIAKAVRHSSGGWRFVKALGMTVDGQAQVSMNLTNFRKTPLARVLETIRREAARYGVGIRNTEVVGLIPQDALVDAAVWYTQLDLFHPDQVLERRIAAGEKDLIQPDFSDQLAAATATPGGGSAAAYAGAMAAGLVSMVARLTIGKKGYEDQEQTMAALLEESENLRAELRAAVDRDAEAFNQVMAAYKKPKSAPDRKEAIQGATLHAAEVPLEVAGKALQVMELALTAARAGNLNAISDAGSGVNLAYAALNSAAYNVRINISSLEDPQAGSKLRKAVEKLETQAQDALQGIKEILQERGGIF